MPFRWPANLLSRTDKRWCLSCDFEAGGLTFADGNRAAETLELRWSTAVHTGAPVPLFALGPNATAFTGLMDNTDVPKQIARLLDLHDFAAGFTQ